MSRSRKWWLAAALVLAALSVLELGYRGGRRPRAAVVLVNGGDSTLRNVAASYAGVVTAVGDLAPGASTVIRLENRRADDVTISFAQEGNPAPGVLIGGEELYQARRDGVRTVLTLKPNEVVRHMEEDAEGDAGPIIRILRRIRDVLFPNLDDVGPLTMIGRPSGSALPGGGPRGILAGRHFA